MTISAKRMAALREHIRAESLHDIDALDSSAHRMRRTRTVKSGKPSQCLR
jgi:hypothetical protein